MTTWALSNPPGAAPDEPTNYVKAIGTSLGQWLPKHVMVATDIPRHRYDDANFGEFHIPNRYVPDPQWACNRLSPTSARCLLTRSTPPSGAQQTINSYVAWYPPIVPFVLGSVARLGHHPDEALYLGRLASVLICIVLLAIALGLVSQGWALVGLLAAVSPMVIFLSSSMSSDGIEAVAGAAHAVVITRLASGDRRKVVWPAYLITGLPLALARQLGPVWIGLDLALLVGLLGVQKSLATLRSQRRSDRVAMLLVLAAAVFTAIWDVAIEHPANPGLAKAVGDLVPSISRTQSFPNQFVGIFGWLDTPLPHLAYGLAELIYAVIVIGALALAN
jgi:Predicted membrane protein (DUF2142)